MTVVSSGTDEPLTGPARAYLQSVVQAVAERGPEATARRVRELVREHEIWRRTCLNLLPSENVTSRAALALLGSEIATRLTEGFPGDKEFPPPRHNVQIDEIEGILIALVRRMFRCRWVEWRASGNTMANAMALEAVTAPGDPIMVQAMEGGANMSYHPGAIPDLLRLSVHAMPPGPLYGVDLDGARRLARSVRPRAVVVGGGYFLFPLPVAELADIAREVGAVLIFDAAHVALFIATGDFPHPLADGADLLTFGTHKVMSGPIGGIVCTDRDDLATRIIDRAHPLFFQTRDQSKYAAQAHALAELAAFGPEYARQMIANARAFAVALEANGFAVLGRDQGHTATHQVVVDVGRERSAEVERRCQEADILLHRGRLPGEGDQPDTRSALRLSVEEVTRLGMEEAEMGPIARLMARVALRDEDPGRVGREVHELARGFQRIRWSFDPG
jgi:glycine hydroxymethyltransferase